MLCAIIHQDSVLGLSCWDISLDVHLAKLYLGDQLCFWHLCLHPVPEAHEETTTFFTEHSAFLSNKLQVDLALLASLQQYHNE